MPKNFNASVLSTAIILSLFPASDCFAAGSWTGKYDYDDQLTQEPLVTAPGGDNNAPAKQLSRLIGASTNYLPNPDNKNINFARTSINNVMLRFQEGPNRQLNVSLTSGTFLSYVNDEESDKSGDVSIIVHLYTHDLREITPPNQPAILSFSRNLPIGCTPATLHNIDIQKPVILATPNYEHPVEAAAYAHVIFKTKVRNGNGCK